MENCYKIAFRTLGDEKNGKLTPIEGGKDVPFQIMRAYYVYDTPRTVVRGFHAHRMLEQVLICISGSVVIYCEAVDGTIEEYILDRPDSGLYVGKHIWHEMREFSQDAILLVFASDHYMEEDYIREYEEFRALGGDKK